MRRSCASQRHYGRDLDASFRRRRIDDALPFFLRMCLGMFSVRKFVISLIGSSENHTWKVHACTIESVQDFLIKLDMKPCIDIVEISIFSLNLVIVRLTKIMNNLL